jgi:cytochrome P450
VVSTYSRLTLDIIGIAALGVNLENLDTPTSFHEYYHQMFDPPPLGQALLALNAFIPVRWIPLQENQQFRRAEGMIRKLLREIIQQRIRDITKRNTAADDAKSKDLLTYMLEETCAMDSPWTEDELLGHVSQKSIIAATLMLSADISIGAQSGRGRP